MKFRIAAAAGLLSCAHAHGAAAAEASIALAHPADDHGWAIGVGYDGVTREDADATALEQCTAQARASRLDAACRVVARFDGECMALAKETSEDGTAWGWAVAAAAGEADAQAMAQCQAYAGIRSGFCQVTMSHCDGTAGK